MDTTDFRRGFRFLYNGAPHEMVEFQHVKPGKGGAFVRTKIRNLLTGSKVDVTFRSGEKVEGAELEEQTLQYLYQDGDEYHFMNSETYEQTFLNTEQLGDALNWLTDGAEVEVLFFEKKPIAVEPPMFVELEVTGTEPGEKGDTASGGNKPATLETGAVVQVPLFVNEGEKVKVDTRTGQYVERVS